MWLVCNIPGIVPVHHPDHPHGPTYIPPKDSRVLSVSWSPVHPLFSTANVHERSRKAEDVLFSQSTLAFSDDKVLQDSALGHRTRILSTLVTQLKGRRCLKGTVSETTLTRGNKTSFSKNRAF